MSPVFPERVHFSIKKKSTQRLNIHLLESEILIREFSCGNLKTNFNFTLQFLAHTKKVKYKKLMTLSHCKSRHVTEKEHNRRQTLYVTTDRETIGGIFIINECSNKSVDFSTQGRSPTKGLTYTSRGQQVSHVTLALLS